jgi:hypothetical protein
VYDHEETESPFEGALPYERKVVEVGLAISLVQAVEAYLSSIGAPVYR